MSSTTRIPSTRELNLPRITFWLAVYLLAAVAGALLGYSFARSAGGGTWMGVVAAANAALFSTLLADWLAGRLAGRRR
jgi:hypothetical protein